MGLSSGVTRLLSVKVPPSRAILLALASGFLGIALSLVPRVLEIEEQLGLGWLYALRPAPAPPDSVVVVGISSESADALGLSTDLDEWPRRLHAIVVERLAAAGAAVIAIDLAFEAPGDSNDDVALANAIAAAGNVVLLERMRDRDMPVPGLPAAVTRFERVPLMPRVSRAALAAAPFPMPTFPIRTSQFWVYSIGTSDTPTLPVVALQAYLRPRYDELAALLARQAPGLLDGLPPTLAELAGADFGLVMRDLRRGFLLEPDLGARLLEDLRPGQRELRSLIEVLSGGNTRYLNFFGPSGTIPRIPYHDLLDGGMKGLAERVQGKAVFIGRTETRQSEQADYFISVFSQRSGLNLSGVEIGATAFDNLLTRRSIRPLAIPFQHLLLLAFAVLLTLALARLRIRVALPLGMALGGGYLAVAAGIFASWHLWLPLVVPLGVQLPVVLAALILLRYRDVGRQRERIQRALGRYVPPEAVERLARDSLELPAAVHELVRGTCLVTDVERYTELAERLSPGALADLMEAYFAALREVVEAHAGFVGDTSGDSLVAVWAAAGDETKTRERALACACALLARVDEFNAEHAGRELRTAVGLESGELALGLLAAGDERPHRVVGDIVNTAARIQGLNRHLGTRALCSDDARADLAVCAFRRLGRFLLLGKRQPVELWEVLPAREKRTARILAELEAFDEAIELFANGSFDLARRRFAALAERGGERLSRFYVEQCDRNARGARGGEGWNGVIVLDSK